MKKNLMISLFGLALLLTSCASTPYHTKGRYRSPVSPKKSCGCMINRGQEENINLAIQMPNVSLRNKSEN